MLGRLPLMLVMATCQAKAVPPVPAGLAQEILVLFARDSAEHARVVEAARGQHPDLGSLRPLARELSAAVGVPLVVQGVASGGTLIVAIDARAMLERVATELRGVSGARTIETPADNASSGPRLRVTGGDFATLDQHVAVVANRLRVPLRTHAEGKETVRVDVALDELAGEVTKRLRAAPHVEHVERHPLMKPLEAESTN